MNFDGHGWRNLTSYCMSCLRQMKLGSVHAVHFSRGCQTCFQFGRLYQNQAMQMLYNYSVGNALERFELSPMQLLFSPASQPRVHATRHCKSIDGDLISSQAS